MVKGLSNKELICQISAKMVEELGSYGQLEVGVSQLSRLLYNKTVLCKIFDLNPT